MNAASGKSQFDYQAFISYSQSADENLSVCLQKGLQGFSKPWYRRRVARVFRDETTLTPNDSLEDSIQAALDNSEFFILLASPAAASSQWVGREIDFWTGRNGTRGLIIVLTEGDLCWSPETGDFDRDRSSALPPNLYGKFEEEPLFLDMRWFDDAKTYTLREPELVDAIATLAAVIHHRPKDELVGEDLRQHKRTLRIAWGTAGLLFCLTVAASIAAIWAVQQRDLAEVREKQTRAQLLAADSERLLREQPEQIELATLLAIESVRLSPTDRGERELASAARLLPGRVAEQYAGAVYEAAISPDGNLVVSGSEQMGVMAWNIKENWSQQLSTPDEIGEQLRVRAIRFSRDGTKLATANGGNVARVWTSLSEEPREFRHQDQVSTLDFTPSADLLATGGKDGFVRVWDIDTGQPVFEQQLSSEEVREVGFSPDGAWLGAVSTTGPVAVYDTNTWERLELERRDPEVGLALAFSPDSTLFAASRAGRAEIWSLPDGHSVMTVQHSDYLHDAFNAGSHYILDMAFSPDGTVLATANRDGTVRLWSPATGEELLRLNHASPVFQIQFTADGKYIGTGSAGMVQLWRLPEGDEAFQVADPGAWGALAISADGSMLVAGGPQDSLRLMDTSHLLYNYQIAEPDDVRAVACHPWQPIIATAERSAPADGSNVRTWRLGAEAELLRSTNLFGVDRLKFTSAGDLLVEGTTGLNLVPAGDAPVTQLFDGRGAGDISLYPGLAAANLHNGETGVWSESSGSRTLTSNAGYAVSHPFSNRNGTMLATLHDAERKHEAIVWSLADGNVAWRVDLTPLTYLLAVDGDGNTLVAADENTLTVIDRGNPQKRSREFNANIRDLYFTDDDTSVLVILDSTVVKVDVKNLSRAVSTSYSNTVQDVSFSPDGRLLAVTTGSDVNVQDIATGQILSSWITDDWINDLCFLASGREVLTGDNQNRATVWNWRPEDWIEGACKRLTRNLSELEMQKYLPGIPYRATCPGLETLSRDQLVNEMFPDTK